MFSGKAEVEADDTGYQEPSSSLAQPAEAFAAALFKLMEGRVQKGKQSSPLELGGRRQWFGRCVWDACWPQDAAARKALGDALLNSPSEISAVMEGMMNEDLASAAPAIGVLAQSSARSWAEYRSRIGAYPGP